jgi:LysM repeat protein
MCDAPLDRVLTRGGPGSVSWLWVGAVTLAVALVVVGWYYWRSRPQPAAVVPTSTPIITNTPNRAPTATPTTAPTPTPSPVPSATPIFHEVQSGETIIYIASYYGTTSDAIMEANGLDETSARLLRPGQALLIPSTGPVGGPAPGGTAQPPQVIHEVESGETLISIAIDYDTTVEAIMDANDLDSPDLIYVGQQLIVPLMPPTLTPTPTPTPTPSSTPGPPYAAPHLLSPGDGAVFEGENAVVLLSWTSVGILRENQAYLVELETPAQTAPVTYTTQGTSWRLPSDLWPTGRRRSLTWRVTAVQPIDSSSDESPEWQPLSLPSETRRFLWR